MNVPLQPPPPRWTAEQLDAMADRAAAYLARDPRWKVGADVVANYRRLAAAARAT